MAHAMRDSYTVYAVKGRHFQRVEGAGNFACFKLAIDIETWRLPTPDLSPRSS